MGHLLIIQVHSQEKKENIMTKLYRGNKLMIVPMDSYYIIHATDSGPKDVYMVNKRRDRADA